MLPAHTVSISIARPTGEVYAYLADPRNVPAWSEFVTAIEPDGDSWIATTGGGTSRFRFAPPNALGVVDHTVSAPPDFEVFVPMRVVPNRNGSEVLFTIFRQPTQDDRAFAEDVALVTTDLRNLKRVLEAAR